MRRSSSPRLPLALPAALLGPAVLLVAGHFPRLAPAGALPEPAWLAAFALLALGAAFYRPLGGQGPGLGAAALPAAVALWGPVAAGWVAWGGILGRQLAAALLARRNGSPRRPDALPDLVAAGAAALATLGAGALWGGLAGGAASPLPDPSAPWPAVGAAVAFALLLAACQSAWRAAWRIVAGATGAAEIDGGRRVAALLARLAPFALDLGGWGLGSLLALVAAAGLRAPAVALLGAIALLALEAARNRRLLELARRHISSFDRVRRASRRMVADGSGMEAVVERIRLECTHILPVSWFQVELLAPEVAYRSWWAGPEGELEDGAPQPSSSPAPLPGLHRRARWNVLERLLEAQGQAVARLRLWCDDRRIEPDGLRLFESLLPQMAASVHRALLDREAKHDPLTGVAVRRVLERRLYEVYLRCCEGGSSMAVVMCDLDFFKRINDTYGHGTGDEALKAVAGALESQLRDTDLCARYGGEEFALLLEETDGSTALKIAERLRRAVEAIDLRHAGREIPLTASAGVAAFPEVHVKAAGELLLLADGALYEAKRLGRNLCLLDLGHGRFLDPGGRLHEAEDRPPAPPAPQIFA